MRLLAPLREAIEHELSACDGARLRAAAARLRARYREPEGGPHLPSLGKCGLAGGEAMSDDLDRAAYLAVRMPATFAAIVAALCWTREACGEDCAEIRSVLDLGSGPGTALWAAAQVFPTLISATAVERDPRLIEIGSRLAAHSGDEAVRQARWLCGDLTSELPAGSWDLVVFAYALNEIGEGHRCRLIGEAWARCSKLLVIIAPGTKAGFGNVLAVRSQMLALGCGADAPALIAPCPHLLDCPMAAAGDWCHFAARVERTSLHRRLKEAVLGHEDEKFSYVAFMRSEQPGAPQSTADLQARGPQQARSSLAGAEARIVRHPRIFSGYAQLTLCTGAPSAPTVGVLGQTEGRLQQTTVTRSQKEDWRRLKRLGWGDRW